MSAYIAFFKKEMLESIRTYRLFIMGIVFLIFGLMSPAIAKLTPQILSMADIQLELPEPTALDAWAQFFKNTGQLGLVILVIVFCGMLSHEFSRGTLINMLTKGLHRSTVLLSKFTAATVIWSLSYLLCLAVAWGYTAYYWDMEGLSHPFMAFFSLWLFGVLLIALILLGGVLFKTTTGSLLFPFGGAVIMLLANISPTLVKYNPITLASGNMALLTAETGLSDMVPALMICILLILAAVGASMMLFNRKQI